MVLTEMVQSFAQESQRNADFLHDSLTRFLNRDWGDVDPEDARMNNYNMDKHIPFALGSYTHEDTKIWLILDGTGNITALYPEEY